MYKVIFSQKFKILFFSLMITFAVSNNFAAVVSKHIGHPLSFIPLSQGHYIFMETLCSSETLLWRRKRTCLYWLEVVFYHKKSKHTFLLELREKNSILDRDLNPGLQLYVLVLSPLRYPEQVQNHGRINLLQPSFLTSGPTNSVVIMSYRSMHSYS